MRCFFEIVNCINLKKLALKIEVLVLCKNTAARLRNHDNDDEHGSSRVQVTTIITTISDFYIIYIYYDIMQLYKCLSKYFVYSKM